MREVFNDFLEVYGSHTGARNLFTLPGDPSNGVNFVYSSGDVTYPVLATPQRMTPLQVQGDAQGIVCATDAATPERFIISSVSLPTASMNSFRFTARIKAGHEAVAPQLSIMFVRFEFQDDNVGSNYLRYYEVRWDTLSNEFLLLRWTSDQVTFGTAVPGGAIIVGTSVFPTATNHGTVDYEQQPAVAYTDYREMDDWQTITLTFLNTATPMGVNVNNVGIGSFPAMGSGPLPTTLNCVIVGKADQPGILHPMSLFVDYVYYRVIRAAPLVV